MKITIEYDDGLPFSSHTIGKDSAAAWRALFRDAANRSTEFAGTAADATAREFAEHLINAVRAAERNLEADTRTDRRCRETKRSTEADQGSDTANEPDTPTAAEFDAFAGESASTSRGEESPSPRRRVFGSGKRDLVSTILRLARVLVPNADRGLWRTYWLYGKLVPPALWILFMSVANSSDISLLMFLIIFGAVPSLYQILVWTAIWKAANRYEGPAIWRRLAKTTVVLEIFIFVMGTFIGLLVMSG